MIALVGLLVLLVPSHQNPRDTLVEGVASIARPGVPGSFTLVGETTWPVVVGKVDDYHEPVVVAAAWEKGKVVAFAHGGFLDKAALDQGETGKLLMNSLRWMRRPGQTVILVARAKPLASYLQGKGLAVEETQVITSERLRQTSILLIDSHQLRPQDIGPIQDFVKQGGGLVTAGLGWGWLQLNGGKSLADHPGNRLLGPAGIWWTNAYTEATAGNGYNATLVPSPETAALPALESIAAGRNAGQASWTLSQAIRTLPANDKLLMPRLDALLSKRTEPIVPTPAKPLTTAQPLERLLFTLQMHRLYAADPDRVRAHASAAGFPGLPLPGAPLVTRSVTVDMGKPGWQSTGLYAAPGKPVSVLATSATRPDFYLLIGPHTDELWHKDTWPRPPKISRRFWMQPDSGVPSKKLAANAFGGLIYIDRHATHPGQEAKITLSDVIEAPYFVLGKTTNEEWKKIRERPAPWAEFQTDKIVITVPSSEIRTLDDPEALMKFWDRIQDANADLAAIPRNRTRPERIVPDVLISAGYMHSGYPIMTHMDVAGKLADVNHLKEGNWGFFHELGHNHQSSAWTFDGTGEVTCNLFALYVLETVCEKEWPKGHPALEKAAKQLEQMVREGKKPWEPDDPFLRLYMYVQMQKAFGWEPFKKVFAEYRAAAQHDLPKTDAEKRDQWLVRFSKTVKRNLGPFFQAWGLPTTPKARQSIADLPGWMPPDWPK